MTLDTTIPFSGFYESWHSRNLEYALAQITQDDNGEPRELLDESGEVFFIDDHIDWAKANEAYAKLYAINFVDFFKSYTGVDLHASFDEMVSPREYNFSTDRIFMHISLESAREIYRIADKEKLNIQIRSRFTSRSGFSSFYSNSLLSWRQETGDVSKWDSNQVGTLIESVLLQFESNDANEFRDDVIMEDADCNGEYDSILNEAMDSDAKLVLKTLWDADSRSESGLL